MSAPTQPTLTKEEKTALVGSFRQALQAAVSAHRHSVLVVSRFMFGGAGFYADGVMFAAWYGGGDVHLKLAEADRTALLAQYGSLDQKSQYVQLPRPLRDDPSQLAAWVAKSLAHLTTPKQPKPKQKGR
jgi:TfoX/Sxy family transcriptional regulator of competence genes